MMRIAADKNQFIGSHGRSNYKKHRMMFDAGARLYDIPLPFGDYCLITEQMQETIDRRGDKLRKADLMGDIKLAIDTKRDLDEVAMNICSSSHGRFRDEAILARKVGAKLIVLVEEDGVTCINDVYKWENPRLKRYNKIKRMHEQGKWQTVPMPKREPVNGKTLAKAMLTMQYRYGVIWKFCKKADTAETIMKLLSDGVK